ncbi:MAG: hypothetical protein IPM82_11515 [Saprospiraceae bacterium]|nr:hypothetical protein [Saprospiraceae bacterium]
MKAINRLVLLLGTLILAAQRLGAQSCESMDIQPVVDIPSACSEMTMTMLHDQLDRPFLYVAGKEGGLIIYDLTTAQAPTWVATIPVSAFENLHVMNLSQSGNYLYLAIGNHFGATQKSGMAIVDVTQPTTPFVTDYWTVQANDGGAGIVVTEGNYAYLGAMRHGLIILDISDKTDIQFQSQFIPDLDFPDSSPDPAKINARGMAVKNGIVYLCYDAGGLRIIDATDPINPAETGRYANPELNGLPRAYNNLVLGGDLAYVAVDYCGLEVLNVVNPAAITLTGWWNPWNCQSNPLNWFVSPGHTNELAFNPACKLLFLSSGKSDLHVLDVSNPSFPDSCNFFGGVANSIGTWGVSTWHDQIYLSYICNPLPFPFPSNWTGVKILSYQNDCLSAAPTTLQPPGFFLSPQSLTNELTVELPNAGVCELIVCNALGQILLRKKDDWK